MKVKSESEAAQSCGFLATPWTAAHQAPQSMGFSRQEYWSGVPLPSPNLGLRMEIRGEYLGERLSKCIFLCQISVIPNIEDSWSGKGKEIM